MKQELQERVKQFFDKHPRESFKSRQVAKRLSVKNEQDFQLLRDVLHGMVEEKKLSYARGEGYHRRSPVSGFTGILRMNKQGTGVVQLEEDPANPVFIDTKYLGTALNGDMVEIALFARNRGKMKKGVEREGEILRVVSRSNTEFVGTLEQSKNFFFVKPDDQRIPRDLYIPREALNGAQAGDKVVVSLEEWESELLNPEGKILEIIGKSGESSAEVQSVIKAFRLPTSFPPPVEDEASLIPETISPEVIRARLDLRKVATFTIDPVDAKDFDDAISIEPLGDGTFRLGVHIADVSHYVTQGSALDGEAYSRGTSVYLANQVIPMLPEKLSNRLCSLMPHVDRLAYSCIMDIAVSGAVKNYSIRRSVINSHKRFTYEEAEHVLDTGKGPHAGELKQLWSIAEVLRGKRMKNGSIDFDSPEAKFRYDERGKPVEVMIKKRLKSNQLVEECMLLANRTVAHHIGFHRTEEDVKPFLYRIHDYPDHDKLRELALFVSKFGHRLNISSSVTSKSLQKLLEEVRGTPEENVINEVALRSMAKAVYSEENIGHYGLAFDFYTHFTSPIRRYPDLIVHRMLDEYERGMSHTRRKEWISRLPDMCRWSSERERVAVEAERESVKVMQAEYMKQHIGDEFDGIISGITKFGIFVEINDLLVEGLVPVRLIEDDYYLLDEKQYSLVGQRTGRRFRLGDTIRVAVARVDVEMRRIDFTIAEKDRPRKSKRKR